MKCFETFQEFDDAGNALNWRACSTDDVIGYVHGDPLIKPNARTATGESENGAIASLCALAEGEIGQYFYLPVLPKYVIGQRVFVNLEWSRKAGYKSRDFYGTIASISGITGSFASFYDNGSGLQLNVPYKYQYQIEEYDGTSHSEVPETYIQLVEDDGA